MSSNSFVAIGSWMGIIAVLWVISFVIAESIPNFNGLLSLISSLFASWFTYGISAMLWLFLNRGIWFRDWRKTSLTILNLGTFALGVTICGVGLYASGTEISQGSGHTWSCADNS